MYNICVNYDTEEKIIIMDFVHIILIVYLALQLLIVCSYIPRIKLWFDGFKKQKHLINTNQNKLAILLPARNESKIIENLLLSIKNQTYPLERFDVHVIVADKNDKTIELTKKHLSNSYIHIIENQTRKAEALDGAIKEIIKSNLVYDDYIIIDADCILTTNFLEEMNNALSTGADIIIPRKRIKNWESNNKKNRNIWCNCSALTWPSVDTMGNKGKSKRNYTLALCGQGMLINAKILNNLNGYPFRSLVEDYEISIECMRNGYTQFYYEYAEIYSEEPISHKEYNKRRVRWLQGFADVTKKYNKEVKNITFKQGRIKKENLFFLFGITPVYLMFSLSIVMILTFLIIGLVLYFKGNPLYTTSLLFSIIPFAISYVELYIHGWFCIAQDRDINKMTKWEKIKLSFAYPFIVSEYIGIFFKSFLVKSEEKWEAIERINM